MLKIRKILNLFDNGFDINQNVSNFGSASFDKLATPVIQSFLDLVVESANIKVQHLFNMQYYTIFFFLDRA